MQNRIGETYESFATQDYSVGTVLSFRSLFRSTLTQFVLQAGFQAVKRALRSVSVRNIIVRSHAGLIAEARAKKSGNDERDRHEADRKASKKVDR